MGGNHGLCAEELMKQISAELGCLRTSIMQKDLVRMERHTSHTRDMLTLLRPLLTREKPLLSPELMELRDSARRCTSVLKHVRRTVRALIGLYRSVGDGFSDPCGMGR
jgi:hypothetical protein